MKSNDGSRRGRAFASLLAVASLGGRASLHSYQVDDIDSSRGTLTPFTVQVDETGLNLHEAMAVGKALHSLVCRSASRFSPRADARRSSR